MSAGKDVKAQLMEALEMLHPMNPDEPCNIYEAHSALSTCVVLTREEAAKVRDLCEAGFAWVDYNAYDTTEARDVLALLTPETGE